MKIIIIEPEMNRQRQLRTILTSLGHRSAEIESAGDSKTALSLMRKRRFDCAFMFMGPQQSEALDILKNLRSGTSKNLPVVIYTNEVTKDNVVAAHEAGASAFLAYPFSVSDVEEVMLKAVGKKTV